MVGHMGTLFGLLLIVGAVIHYWWGIAAGAAVLYGWYKWRVFRLACDMTAEAEAKRQAAIAARADQQHQWVWVGDPRAVYGVYTPTAL
jgi:hypothetical protein